MKLRTARMGPAADYEEEKAISEWQGTDIWLHQVNEYKAWHSPLVYFAI